MRVQEDEGEQVFGNGMTTSQMKKSTGAYFDKMQNANASRSDKIKPSEGGKYGGFGSGGQAHQMSSGSDDFVGKLSEGWSFLSAAATTVAAKAAQKTAELGSQLNENVIAPTREKLADSTLMSSVGEKLSTVASRITKGEQPEEDFFAHLKIDDGQSKVCYCTRITRMLGIWRTDVGSPPRVKSA